ncbi:hypothetical protein [Veillonella parvula]|jgi:hypothetical protein|uniref:hypothetical protein n=1 Tax=Veillonella parvula TaxID=29466 RepID=UPI00206181C0|nr:hypothetical protein [Veillonella parvula]DAK21984.1 MAG TPA: hypothetical protein [Caudoviricetes sp.]
MRIYDDIRILGMEDAIYILQRALTFVYEDNLLEPKIDFDFGRFRAIYKKNNINIGIEISMIELKCAKLTLEQFALDIKQRVISQYRNEINKLHEVRQV